MEDGETIIGAQAKKMDEAFDSVEEKLEPLLKAPPYILILGWAMTLAIIIGVVLTTFAIFSIPEIIMLSLLGAVALYSAIEREVGITVVALLVMAAILMMPYMGHLTHLL